MAVEYGWTGFESGDIDFSPVGAVRGGIIGHSDLPPRTGQFMYAAVSGDVTANVWQAYRRKGTTIGNPVGGGNTATTLARVFFRIRAFPVGATGPCGILESGSLSTGGTVGGVALNLNGTFRCFVWVAPVNGPSSTAVLSADVWYRADLSWTVSQTGVNATGTAVCSVYTEAGTLIETVTHAGTGVITGGLPIDVTIGNGTGNAVSYAFDYDDWWWGTADGADVATLAFPTAMRVAYVGASGQGASATWTGDYRTQIDRPFSLIADNQTAPATPATSTTFTHPTAASLGISGIEGVIVRANMRSTASSGNESLLLGGVAYTVPVTTVLSILGQNGVNFAGISDATFDGWEFGARNDRGTQLLMANCYLEVLHNGSAGLAPYVDVADPFSLNIITWTGNGTYKTVAGMGFPSQVALVFGVSSSLAGPGWMWSPRNGGTRGIPLVPGSQETRNGILSVTTDGFELGPSLNANQNGTVYLAIGIRDGGTGGGYFMTSRSRMGSSIDNEAIVFKNGFTLDMGMMNCNTGNSATVRASYMAGDFAIGYGGAPAVTNLIQGVTATGYLVGNASGANSVNQYLAEFLMRIGTALTGIMHVGTMTPTGTTATITGIPFTPIWIAVVKQVANTPAFWRSSLTHATANSTGFGGGLVQPNGVTAITADGATIGSALAQNGVPVHWIAFGPGSLSVTCGPETFPNGVDSGGGAGCLPAIGNGVDSGGGLGCQVSL